MSDPVTALGNKIAKGAVQVEETGPHGMLTLRADLADAAVGKAVTSATAIAMPETRRLSASDDRALLWMSPDEALLVLPRSEAAATSAALTRALGKTHALVAEMSDARACFRVTGDDAHVSEVLARLVPVDMPAFEVGEVRRTRLAQIAAALWKPAEGEIRLVCFRSVAQYAFDLLAEAAASPRIG